MNRLDIHNSASIEWAVDIGQHRKGAMLGLPGLSTMAGFQRLKVSVLLKAGFMALLLISSIAQNRHGPAQMPVHKYADHCKSASKFVVTFFFFFATDIEDTLQLSS